MFVFERILGVAVYLMILLIFSVIVCLSNQKTHKTVFFVYTIVLSIMAYYFIPNKGSDLFRLIPIMELYAQMDINEILVYAFNTNAPFAILYMYIIGQFDKPGLLPVVTSFLFYSNVFFILQNSASINKSKSKDVGLLLFYFMAAGVYIEVITGIRSMLAISIVAVSFFKEIYKDKSFIKSIFFYVIASLIHPLAIVLVVLRFVVFLFKKEDRLSKSLLNIMTIIIIVILTLSFGKNYIVNVLEKSEFFLSNEVFFFFWEYVKALFSLLIILSLVISVTKIYKIKLFIHDKAWNYFFFFAFSTIINIVFFFEYSIFHRMMTFNTILSIPMALYAFNIRELHIQRLKYLIFIISILILLIAITRGNLSSYKFLD